MTSHSNQHSSKMSHLHHNISLLSPLSPPPRPPPAAPFSLSFSLSSLSHFSLLSLFRSPSLPLSCRPTSTVLANQPECDAQVHVVIRFAIKGVIIVAWRMPGPSWRLIPWGGFSSTPGCGDPKDSSRNSRTLPEAAG